MDVREKLVELLNEVQETGVNEIPAGFGYTSEYIANEKVASHLTAHGVTVQEWISVKDRLPEESGLYITFGCTAVPVRLLHNFDKDIGKFGAWWNYEPDGKEHQQYRFIEAGNITHWMPLPQQPKGDNDE